MMAPIQLALDDIRAGRLRALGVTTKSRSHLLPEVPSIAEAASPASTIRFGMECGCPRALLPEWWTN
jgi:tripartite-type tricarboxylate transporter receptor subunit TctC